MARAGKLTPAAFLILAAAVGAQGPPAGSPKPARVEGVVMNELSGEPLPKAHISFRIPKDETARAFGAISTAEGKFSIDPIDSGNYRVTVERAGYITRGEGAVVKVGSGDRIADLALKLMPEAVIAGRVLDSSGDPVEHVNVEAVRAGPRSEQLTNARGEFRIGELPGGKYLVRAAGADWGQQREIRVDGSEDQHYGLTYYPGTLREAEAAVVAARAGAETGGIVIRLARTPAGRISGVLTDAPEGVKRFHLRLTEVRSAHEMGLTAPRFEMWGLPNGRYSLWTMCTDLKGRLWQSAYMEFEARGVDIDNLDLQLMLPFDIRGRVDWDGQPTSAAEGEKPELKLQPFVGWADKESTELQQDGTFLFAKAPPGQYRIELTGMPENVYVKSVRQGSVEMPNQVLDARNGLAEPVAITLSGKGARISGVIRDSKGPVGEASVGLIGDGENGFDFFRTVRAGADGSYRFSGVAPGTYRVFAFDFEDSEHLRKNRSLPFYVNRVEKIELADGDRVSRDLTVD